MKLSPFKFFCIIFSILTVLDFLTTDYVIKNGIGYEANIFLKNIVENTPIFFVVKIVIGVLIMCLIKMSMNKSKTKLDKLSCKIGMNIICIFMFLVVMNNFITIANAESGNIVFDSIYEPGDYGYSTVSTAGTIEFNKILFYNTSYNSIGNFRMTLPTATFTKDFNSTAFTIVSGGIGSGWAYFYKSTNSIYYVFDTGNIITSSSIELSFSYDIFTGVVSYTPLGEQTPSSTKPVCVKRSIGVKCVNIPTSGTTYYDVSVGLYGVDSYTVDYPIEGYFRVNIDKNDYLSSKYIISGSSSTYDTESSFNKVNIVNALFPYNDGIILNGTLSGGYFTSVIVNRTNCPLCGSVETPSNPIASKPVVNANISFDKNSYIVNDFINVSWYISDTNFNNFYPDRIEVYENGILRYSAGIPQNSYYRFRVDKVGKIDVYIKEGLIFLDTIAVKSVNVIADSPSYMNFNNTQLSRTAFNISYFIGHSVSDYPNAVIDITIKNDNTGNNMDTVFLTVFPSSEITVGSINKLPVGKYTVYLYDAVKDKILDTQKLTVIERPISTIPTLNISTSFITVNKGYYFFNEFMTVEYAIDDYNFSNYNIKAYLNNSDKGITTKYIIKPFNSQIGSFDTLISNNRNQLCEGMINCYFETGVNVLSLHAYNDTVDFEIANDDFTVSKTTVDGWGILTDKSTFSTNETIIVKVIVPTNKTGNFLVQDAGYSINSSSYAVYQVNNIESGTTTYKMQILRVNTNGVGYYNFNLYDVSTNKLKVQIPITINRYSVTDTPIKKQNTIKDVDSPITYMVMIFVLFCLIGYALAREHGVIGGLMLGTIVNYKFGYIEEWVILFIFLGVALAVGFMFSKQTK